MFFPWNSHIVNFFLQGVNQTNLCVFRKYRQSLTYCYFLIAKCHYHQQYIFCCPVLVLFGYWMQFEIFPDILIKGLITSTLSPATNLNIFSFHKSNHFQKWDERNHYVIRNFWPAPSGNSFVEVRWFLGWHGFKFGDRELALSSHYFLEEAA